MTPIEWLEQDYHLLWMSVSRDMDYTSELSITHCPDAWVLGAPTGNSGGGMFSIKEDDTPYADLYHRANYVGLDEPSNAHEVAHP